MKLVLFWKPTKRYFCPKCNTSRYISNPNYIINGVFITLLLNFI
ncbi:hypothetical protein QE417_003893 [Mucilaginibacter terrae]|uniref:Transposase zinc-ribbon domain-containing protein n=1 Tax=Mucilaginibacter terrae TaxID=1955052 RepID=A0ABU3GYH1_9SPHI|nr:hypothetical protein [Mucilaginibacter terrae]